MENEGLIDENYEPDVTNVVRRFVHEGSICVDAGASIGYFTCLMADIVGPRGLVMAFEPNGPSFEYLEDNIRRRGLFNVRADEVGMNAPSGDSEVSELAKAWPLGKFCRSARLSPG